MKLTQKKQFRLIAPNLENKVQEIKGRKKSPLAPLPGNKNEKLILYILQCFFFIGACNFFRVVFIFCKDAFINMTFKLSFQF